MKLFFSPAYVGAIHAFETTRKAQWIVDSLSQTPIEGIELIEPRPLTVSELCAVHAPEYVEAVQTGQPTRLAESNGFAWDPGIWSMAQATNGGAVAAALAALEDGVSGSLSSGLHHARRERGAGFCTFNGLALAAKAALDAGAKRVLILDLDAHCGGGTESLIRDDERIWQRDVSVSNFDKYADNRPRIRLDFADDRDYLETVRCMLDVGPQFDLCLYNAGMDPHGSVTAQTLAQREELVFEWARGRHMPLAFVLAGGYLDSGLDRDGLVDLHRLTLQAAVA
jgi:acetoin utilization deacetylase AcuC-like enzyme